MAATSLRKYTVPGNMVAKGFEQLTGMSTVKTLTPPTGARIAVINAESQAIRWRDDGTDPTAAIGMVIAAGDTYTYLGQDLTALKLIEVSASAKANVTYYG